MGLYQCKEACPGRQEEKGLSVRKKEQKAEKGMPDCGGYADGVSPEKNGQWARS